ncbi:MAG: hypothetical protein HYS04_17190 [Acidobacteria bacterium]|nr:hypothetical protein [Acidobacteriota bacterium]
MLARLGKRPSLRTWAELWKRTTASLFINTYLNREEAWAVTLAVKKAAMGLEVSADAVEEALDSLDDIDWDDLPVPETVVGIPVRGVLETFAGATGFVVGVGADGVRRIGRTLDNYGEEILQAVLAGGIIYYHGMAIAADCLALDAEHRERPEMNRTVGQAVAAVSVAAAALVRKQVRELRSALKKKRQLTIRSAIAQPRRKTASAVSRAAGWVHQQVRKGFRDEPSPVQETIESAAGSAASLHSGYVEFHCPHCRQRLRVASGMEGRRVRCPGCSEICEAPR